MLAAPQIGMPVRVIVLDCVWQRRRGVRQPIVLVNPDVDWSSKERVIANEGCLSIPGCVGEVERPAEVGVRWLALDGARKTGHFWGQWATCVQHEIDHLNGTLFIDHLKSLPV